jgi:UDP-3-O-[3-hydroxymyristoyl] N-acetylglucosamine deacetylase
MHQRQTLASRCAIDGVGLHSGRQIRMRLVPATAGTGIVFVRTDADDVEIPARLEHLGTRNYATVLQRGEHAVSTVEHLLAALYALQIDDLRVEVDGPEVPILDGSSKPFVDRLLEVGRVELDAPRLYMTLVRPLAVTHEEKRIAVYPCSEYRVTYAIDFDHPQLGYQELTASLWRSDDFAGKLAPARTFTFQKDVERLRQAGLALGGSLDNAVVLGEDGILNESGLRFADEFVRHKMLDLTGDLALLGYPLRGHVVAYRAGHDLHSRLARRIAGSPDCWYLAPWQSQSSTVGAATGA